MIDAGEGAGQSPRIRLQVGDWTVEPDLNEVWSAQARVRLEPKSMAVLAHLAERPGQVVTRIALLSAVWPKVVVGDDSLTQVVIKLRKALGDVPGKPAYIQTVSKGGYRLIAPVRRLEPSAVAATARQAGSAPVGLGPRDPRLVSAGIAALLLAGAGLWWNAGRRAPDAPAVQVPSASAIAARMHAPTVAIRPFESLSGDPNEALLAQGVTADLVTDLSKVFGLWVIGGAPGEGHADSEPQSASAPVSYLVSGSVQRVDRRMRLHVRLTEVGSGRLLWSERYDSDVNSLFAIQDDLASRILKVLPAEVSEAELRRVARRHTESLEAYEHFQRGNLALLTRQREENENARKSFHRAIELDGDFARAYAGLALTHAADYRNGWTTDGASALERAFELASTASQIDPEIPETHWVLAFVSMERRQHAQALRHLQTAVRLNPSFGDGYALIGSIQTYIGRPADSLASLRTALRLDPQGSHLHFMNLGRAYLFLDDLEQAQLNLGQAVSRNPANLETHVYLAALYVLAGDDAAAQWEAQEIDALRPGFSIRGWLGTYPMTDEAQKKKLADALAALGF